jgi:hypothetical protein
MEVVLDREKLFVEYPAELKSKYHPESIYNPFSAYSDEVGHLFRRKSAGHSDEVGHPLRGCAAGR